MSRSGPARIAIALSLVALIPAAAVGQSAAPSGPPGSVAPSGAASAAPTVGNPQVAVAWTWAKLAPPPGEEGALVLDVAAGPAGDFIALARPGLNDTSGPGLAWRSPDGVSLTSGTIDKSTAPTRLTSVGDAILATAGGKIFRSTDGSKWKAVKAKLKGSLVAATASPEGILAVGGSDTPYDTDRFAFTSPDGKKWKSTKLPLPDGVTEPYPDQVAVSPDGVAVITGDSRMSIPVMWASADRTTWEVVPLPVAVDMSVRIEGVVATPTGLLLALSKDQKSTTFWSSTDGVAWTQVSELADAGVAALGVFPTDATGVGGGLIAAARDRVLTSADGVTWTDTAVPELAGDNVVAVTGTADGRIAIVSYVPNEYDSSVTVGTPVVGSGPTTAQSPSPVASAAPASSVPASPATSPAALPSAAAMDPAVAQCDALLSAESIAAVTGAEVTSARASLIANGYFPESPSCEWTLADGSSIRLATELERSGSEPISILKAMAYGGSPVKSLPQPAASVVYDGEGQLIAARVGPLLTEAVIFQARSAEGRADDLELLERLALASAAQPAPAGTVDLQCAAHLGISVVSTQRFEAPSVDSEDGTDLNCGYDLGDGTAVILNLRWAGPDSLPSCCEKVKTLGKGAFAQQQGRGKKAPWEIQWVLAKGDPARTAELSNGGGPTRQLSKKELIEIAKGVTLGEAVAGSPPPQ